MQLFEGFKGWRRGFDKEKEVFTPEKKKHQLSGEMLEWAMEHQNEVEDRRSFAKKLMEIENRSLFDFRRDEGFGNDEMLYWNNEQWAAFLEVQDNEKIAEAREVCRLLSWYEREARRDVLGEFLEKEEYILTYEEAVLSESEQERVKAKIAERDEKRTQEISPEELGKRVFAKKLGRDPEGTVHVQLRRGCLVAVMEKTSDADDFFGKGTVVRAGFFSKAASFKVREFDRVFPLAVAIKDQSGVKMESVISHEIQHFANQVIYSHIHKKRNEQQESFRAGKDEILSLLAEEGAISEVIQNFIRTRETHHRCFVKGEGKEGDEKQKILDELERVLAFAGEEGLINGNRRELVTLLHDVPFVEIPAWIAAYAVREKRLTRTVRA